MIDFIDVILPMVLICFAFGGTLGIAIVMKMQKPVLEAEKQKNFNQFLFSNKIQMPKTWKYLDIAGWFFLMVFFLSSFLSPIFVEKTRSTVVNPEKYSLFKIAFNTREYLLIIVTFWAFLMLAFDLSISFISGRLRSSFYRNNSKNKQEFSKKESSKYLLSSLICNFFALLSLVIFCVIVFFTLDKVSKIVGDDIVWGWGTYVSVISGFLSYIVFQVLQRKYNKLRNAYLLGAMTDEEIIVELQNNASKSFKTEPAAQPKQTLTEQLVELNNLKDMGLITEEEYETKKKHLLK